VNDTRRPWSRRRTRHAGLPRAAYVAARDRTHGAAGACSRGEEAQESTGPTTSPWPGRGSPRERTPEGSKASKWACRPLTGEPDVFEQGSSRQRVLLQRKREPSSRPMRPASLRASRGKGSTRRGKPRKSSRHVAPGGGRTRTHKEAQARESGYGSSRGESSEGRLQGRERHGTRPRSVGAPRETTGSARGSHDP